VERDRLAARLAAAGCVAPLEEADELLEAAAGDPAALSRLVERRTAGEPLAWVTGTTTFAGLTIRVHPSVYVPRWQTEPLAERAAALLPEDGVAVDLCTGSGAIAAVLRSARPRARILATDSDPAACRCARANGVLEVFEGDLADPLPDDLRGSVDVVTAVAPYVPTPSLEYLPRDTLAYEPLAALDGGPDGTDIVVRAVRAAAALLRAGGHLVVELGGTQDHSIALVLETAGFEMATAHLDEEGDLRWLETVRA
jgi:release factor glutamine methyltransferase